MGWGEGGVALSNSLTVTGKRLKALLQLNREKNTLIYTHSGAAPEQKGTEKVS